MTPEETRQAAAVMIAYAEGKPIQWRLDKDDDWQEAEAPRWDWVCNEYRVAPERWSGKIWVHADGTVIPYCPSHDRANWGKVWRLIEAKEVEP